MISKDVIFFFLTLVHLVIGDQTNKYCEMCDTPGSHTMCKYPSGPSELCKNYDSRVLSAQDKKLILLEHNKIRNNVALGLLENRFGVLPPAANMRQLAWDEELQEVAQRWVDQCMSFGSHHQKDACRKSSRFEVGQNVGAAVTTQRTSPNYPHLIDVFYMDHRDFDPKRITTYEDTAALNNTEQFIQLIWANSAFLGCAFASFQDQTHANFRWINRIVCNYGPAGNVVGEKVYEVGLPCSYCPDGTICNPHFGGLCATESQLKEDSKDPPKYKIPESPRSDLRYTNESNTSFSLSALLQMRILNDLSDDSRTTPTHFLNENVKDSSSKAANFPFTQSPISRGSSWTNESNSGKLVERSSFESSSAFTTGQSSTSSFVAEMILKPASTNEIRNSVSGEQSAQSTASRLWPEEDIPTTTFETEEMEQTTEKSSNATPSIISPIYFKNPDLNSETTPTMENEITILADTSEQTIQPITTTTLMPEDDSPIMAVEEEVKLSPADDILQRDDTYNGKMVGMSTPLHPLISPCPFRYRGLPSCLCLVDDEGEFVPSAGRMQSSVEISIILFSFNGALIFCRFAHSLDILDIV